jgi:hypothetical protein
MALAFCRNSYRIGAGCGVRSALNVCVASLLLDSLACPRIPIPGDQLNESAGHQRNDPWHDKLFHSLHPAPALLSRIRFLLHVRPSRSRGREPGEAEARDPKTTPRDLSATLAAIEQWCPLALLRRGALQDDIAPTPAEQTAKDSALGGVPGLRSASFSVRADSIVSVRDCTCG